MPRAIRGVLIECEPAIKSILIHIDSTQLNNDAIIEDLDETHLMVKEQMVKTLQARLDEVSSFILFLLSTLQDCEH